MALATERVKAKRQMTKKSLTTAVLKIRSVYFPLAFDSVITAIVVEGEVAVARVPNMSERANP